MKKIFLIALSAFGFATLSQAQLPDKQVKAITAADTITIPNVGSKVVSLDAGYLEGTGTSAGKFYIEGSVDGLFWTNIDSSKSLSDVATMQGIHVAVTATTYKDYRLRCSNTSSATATLYFTVFRRPDDRSPSPCPIPLAVKSKYISDGSFSFWRMRSQYVTTF